MACFTMNISKTNVRLILTVVVAWCCLNAVSAKGETPPLRELFHADIFDGTGEATIKRTSMMKINGKKKRKDKGMMMMTSMMASKKSNGNMGMSMKKSKDKRRKKKKKKQADPDPSTATICQGFKQYVTSTSTKYDKLILPGFDEMEVTWDVYFYSQETDITLSIPYASADELPAIDAMVEQVKMMEPDTNSTGGVQTQLELPDFLLSKCTPSSNTARRAHITVPRSVRSICFGDSCRMVLCPVGSPGDSKALSSLTSTNFIPGNNQLYFGNRTDCVIENPAFWSDFVDEYFGNHTPFVSEEDWYTMDLDGDGASNIVEYYGGVPIESLFADSLYNSSDVDVERLRALQVNTLPEGSTDPNVPDTDGDLFTDGYEILYGMDAIVPNSVTADSDGDSLTDFTEQIFKTNPFRIDSDGDGVSDAKELQDGTNPLDSSSFFNSSITLPENNLRALEEDDPCEPKTVSITLTVGDPSGSESERYTMQVGQVEHQATEFGRVRTGTYSFTSGTYVVTVRHRDSRLSTPDYDYRARITWSPSEDFEITLSDPQQLLGDWYISGSDRTIGKVATLSIVELDKEMCDYSTCKDCRADSNCFWDLDSKTCVKDCRWFQSLRSRPQPEDCPCEKCKAWASRERENLNWIDSIPQCPCQATVNTVPRRGRNPPRTWLSGPSDIWSQDFSCNPNKDCGAYHPGAYGCLRAPSETTNAGQQCCFDRTGSIILSGRGAGTPDKEEGTVTNVYDHHEEDVWTFEDCCVDCEIPSVCEEYIGGADTTGVRQDRRGCVP